MLAAQLKNYLKDVPDESNIKIFVSKTNEVRQLLMADLDRCINGGKTVDVVIDAEYEAPIKRTEISPHDVPKPC